MAGLIDDFFNRKGHKGKAGPGTKRCHWGCGRPAVRQIETSAGRVRVCSTCGNMAGTKRKNVLRKPDKR